MKRVTLAILLTIFSTLPLACGKGGSSAGGEFDSEAVIGAGCAVAPDQRKSFMAKVPGFPLQLTVDADFTAEQRSAITTATDQWNQLGHQLMGQDFFQLRFASIAVGLRSADPRTCTRGSLGGPGVLSVLREQSSPHWQSLGFGENIPGATLRCYSGTEVSEQVTMIYTAINAGKGIDPAQFSSVMLHELGHALGLDHSCDDKNGGSDKFRSCSGLPESHTYHTAVMYPSLRISTVASDAPEVKDRLRANDVLRTSCLYRAAP
jgi:hypothetical protein